MGTTASHRVQALRTQAAFRSTGRTRQGQSGRPSAWWSPVPWLHSLGNHGTGERKSQRSKPICGKDPKILSGFDEVELAEQKVAKLVCQPALNITAPALN